MTASTQEPPGIQELALDRHYSVPQVAKLWGWSESKVREMFRNEPGVLQAQLPRLLRRRSHKRQNVSLRIPHGVLLRVHRKWRVGGDAAA